MPSPLAETVFLSNAAEAEWLGDGIGTRQQEITITITLANGITTWSGVQQSP